MAIGVTKVNANALGVVAVDESALSASFSATRGGDQSSAVTHFTVSRNPTFVAIVIKNGSSEAIDISNEMDVNESVEAVLRVCAENASILGYQVEASGGQISVMLEGPHTQSTYGALGTSSFATDLQSRIQALGTAVGANSIDVSGSTVTNVAFKLALS
jgi:hypothetical protein